MRTVVETNPLVHFAHHWIYDGGPNEGSRVGYLYALHLFTEGIGQIVVDGRKYDVEKGTLIFIRPGQKHSFHFRPGCHLVSINIYFDLWKRSAAMGPSFAFDPNEADSALMTTIEPCPELDRLPTKHSLNLYPHLTELFAQIPQAFDAAFYGAQAAASLVFAFFLRWSNFVMYSGPADCRIAGIMEEMERHPERNLRYEEWCARCGLEKTQFYKLFHKETNMTPKQYLLKMKMKKAAVLLQESRESISSVALRLGYDSVHYFSRQFTAFYGINPSQFHIYRLRS